MRASFFQDVSFPLIKKYQDFVVTLLPSELLRYGKKSPQKKYALLACFCYVRGVQFIDNLIDILLSLTHKIVNRAKKKAKSDFWRDRRIIYNKDIVLRGVATVSIDYPRGIIEEKIYPKVGRDTLEKIVQAPENFGDYYMKKRYHYMQLSYVRHYRRMISPILKNIEICSKNIKNHKILSSLALIKKYLDSKDTYYPKDETIPDIVPKGAKVAVIEENDSGTRVHKAKYELTLLKILRTRLRCKDMWAEGAFKYRDPDKDLPQDFLQDKERYYKEIQKPRSAEKFISDLKETLNYWLVKLNQNIPRNKKVRITTRGHKPWIKLSPSKAQKTPPNIDRLRQDILMRWPHISLLDVLKEVELRLDITSVFESLARTERIPKHELQYKIILCLFAFATNTGLKRVSAHMPDVSYDDLKYIQKRFINKDNLRHAIRKVINGNLAIRDKDLFGGVTISCACDSTKFRAWDQNLMTEWHVRYRGPGIMVYWHVDRKSLCVYSQFKTCSSSEIVSMIEGIINHATRADVKKSYVDSNSQSLVAFSFSDLLDFSLLPRLKRIGEERLLFPESRPQDLKNIESLFIRAANWSLVEENYDPMIQSAVVLKLKITEPESLLKKVHIK